MNTPETINIEKYAEALNNLIGVDSAYFQGDKNVDAIVEVIRAAKALENRVKELEADNKKWQERLDREAKCQYDLAGQIVDLKSEVDLYKRLNDELEDELASTYDKLENAKADYAREIFDDISKDAGEWGCYCISAFKWGYVTSDVSQTLVRLRKKYVEGNNE